MDRRLISSGSTFEASIGYSRAVVADPWVFVAGCTGYDYATSSISPSVVSQAEQCFVNIDAALKEAGASMADIVRVRYILVDKKEFKEIWEVCRKWLGEVRPAATMIEAGLAEEAMRVEVEVTALKRDGSGSGGGASAVGLI